MATGYIKINRERPLFKFYLDRPIEERENGNYAMVISGNLYLALGEHYIMFRFDKELNDCTTKYVSDIWNKILSDRLNASYNPSYDRLNDGIIDFTIYISLDQWSHYELVMAMDLYYNPVDSIE
jgi:hypothetical protein